MSRNLDKRMELMIPIEEPPLKRRLVRMLETFFQDNTQASRILPDGTSQRIVRAKGQKASVPGSLLPAGTQSRQSPRT
jgi:polyphosphate kinase